MRLEQKQRKTDNFTSKLRIKTRLAMTKQSIHLKSMDYDKSWVRRLTKNDFSLGEGQKKR